MLDDQQNLTTVYAVGSNQKRRFIVDIIFDNREDAIRYCDRRRNNECSWRVEEVPLNRGWVEWTSIHTTPKEDR